MTYKIHSTKKSCILMTHGHINHFMKTLDLYSEILVKRCLRESYTTTKTKPKLSISVLYFIGLLFIITIFGIILNKLYFYLLNRVTMREEDYRQYLCRISHINLRKMLLGLWTDVTSQKISRTKALQTMDFLLV